MPPKLHPGILCLLAASALHAADAEKAPTSKPEPSAAQTAPATPQNQAWKAHDMARPRPAVVTPPDWGSNDKPASTPSDAHVLFDGKDLSQWKRDPKKDDPNPTDDAARWKVENGYFQIAPGTGGIRTRDKFKGDIQLHLEWATPSEVKGNSQGRGNSGVFLSGFPEIQVLDSYENDTYPDGQAAALYGKHPPLVNASRKPGQWQTYDILVERPVLGEKGEVLRKARLTVIHNGLVVQLAREFDGKTMEGDLSLQDHGNPGRFRNFWWRPLAPSSP